MKLRHVAYAAFITAVAASLLAEHADGGPRNRARRGTRPLGTSTTSWTPETDLSNLVVAFSARSTSHIWKESAAGPALNRALIDGDTVGQIDSPTGMILQSGAASRNPILTSDSDSSSHFLFSTAGTLDFMQVLNSTVGPANFLHETCIGTVALHVESTADGAAYRIWDQNNSTSANAGLALIKTAANKFQVLLTSAGARTIVNYTSTPDFTVASGRHSVFLQFTGTNLVPWIDGVSQGNQALTTANCQAGTVGGTIHIGSAIGGGGAGANMRLQDIYLSSSNISDATTIARFHSYNPARTSDSLVASTDAASGYFSFLGLWYDFGDTSRLFQAYSGATCSTAVTTSGDPIRCVLDKRAGTNTTNRAAKAPSDAARPTYRGTDGAEWDGSNDTIKWTAAVGPTGGAQTFFAVVLNEDTVLGSNFLRGSQYVVVSGDTYVGNPGGQAYFTIHTASGSPADRIVNSETSWNVIDWRRDGSNWSLRAGTAESTGTNSSGFTVNESGTETNVGWWFDGYMREFLKFNVALTNAQRDTVRAGLVAKWSGITKRERRAREAYADLTGGLCRWKIPGCAFLPVVSSAALSPSPSAL